MLTLLLVLALQAPKEFHQGVAYRIEARLNETSHVLTGRAQLRYTNHAPKALDTLYFHLHLNAFRPNSAWARRELEFGQRRYQELGPDDYAYDRIRWLRVNGRAVKPFFPHAPDSTVMGVPLPRRLQPRQSALVNVEWTSRLATIPRRQGRAGRHYDWAHWYPRIAVYDTAGWETQVLLPQGEFFGEFGSYDVTLDVAADQILAATGVPVTGDPGWARVNRDSAHPPMLQRTAYAARTPSALGLLSKPQAGRKRVRFRAEHVHHFAWAADPAFVYEGDHIGDVALHALFLPGDTLWPGSVITTLKRALLFYDTVMGPYLYPQLTAVRRVEGGGTEFPMMQMDGASPPVVHEAGHEWAHAMLANNEFRDGWLDEGFTSFLGFLYGEAGGRTGNFQRAVDGIAAIDASGRSQPVATPGAQFHDFNLYQQMTYTKASLVLRMLRFYIGDEALRAGLRLYYQNNKLQHVDENDLRTAMEQASGRQLGEFFRQWLHTTGTLDYAIASAVTVQQANGEWHTRVEITRTGENWAPVDLRVGDKTVRIDTHDAGNTTVVVTAAKPADAVLDPEYVLIDTDRSNNRKPLD
ncbi:MAG TPA: M1 family metallopeptidase [Longimicrobiales bacterium]